MSNKEFHQSRQLLRKALLQEQQRRAIASGNGSDTCLATSEGKQFEIKGRVEIQAVYPNGERKTLVDAEPNLVVRQAEEIMPYMTVGLRQMHYIELGDPTTPNPPAAGDTTLQQTTGQRKAVSSSINGNQATYEASWSTGEGNGFDFTEAGLFTNPLGTGLLFARKVFDSISKTSDFSLVIKWGIVFTVTQTESGCAGVSLLGSSTVTSDYVYTSSSGGETNIIVPIDFNVGAKQLDVFLNGQRLVYNEQYYENTIGGAKGITLIGFSLNTGDKVYFVNRKLA